MTIVMWFWQLWPQRWIQCAATQALLLHCILLAMLCLILQVYQPQLLYQAELLWFEPWRLWTAHLVHVGWMHAALNLTALLLLPWIFPQYPVRRFWLVLVLGCPLLSLCLNLILPDLQRYAGLSGVLHGIYFSAATHAIVTRTDRLVGWILYLILTMKLIFENMTSVQATAELIGAPVLTQAHYLGVAVALLLGAILGHFPHYYLQKGINLDK